jgi:hypothetical protein
VVTLTRFAVDAGGMIARWAEGTAARLRVGLLDEPAGGNAAVRRLFDAFHAMILGRARRGTHHDLPEPRVCGGIREVKCAALCWHAMRALDTASPRRKTS